MRAMAVFVAAFVAAAGAFAEPGPDARTAIVSVIEKQIEAFRRDDDALAFSLASPNIQRQFRTPENFMRMVIAGYQPVYRPRAVTFLDLIEDDGLTIQSVMVVGPDGVAVLAFYPMIRMEDGSWRIDGCVLAGLPGKGI